MPRRSKITQLPPEIKAKLDRMLFDRSFANYDEIAAVINAELADTGYEITISRSGLHRYGQAFEERLAAIKIASEQARAVSEAVGDNEGVMNDALIGLVQEKAFDVLVNLQTEDPKAFAKIFPKLGIMVAKLSKASVDQKKWMADARKKALEEAAASIEATAKQEGVSSETIAKIRRDVLLMAG
ncbi:MAG: DUF3486 family protein [Syntrophobacterales bacterium]|nr:DUF3486 family protein [Syntrophobacterales bacterium]